MPIELRTGLPGAGKSLGAVEYLLELRKRSPERPVYQLGIDELRDGLAIPITADDLKKWKDLPAGAIVFVDECQKYMPAKRGTAESPQWIRDLSEHRHLGLDFVFITQHPSLIDTYVRKLVDRHIHTVRKYGTYNVERWRWPICQADPNSVSAKRQAEQKSVHRYSREAMASYKSAELHTVKRTVPRFLIIGAVVLVVVPVLAWAAIHIMRVAGHKRATASLPSASGSASSSAATPSHTLSRDEWIKRFMPRVSGIPWSAPAYDDRKVQAQPDVYCAKIQTGPSTFDCRCITEQGTHADVPGSLCLAMVRDGLYNPFRAPSASLQSLGQGVALSSYTDAAQSTLPAVPPISSVVDPVSSDPHADRVTSQFYVPPTYGKWDPTPLPGGSR